MSRDRNLLVNARAASSQARLPALMRPKEGDWSSLLRWIDAAQERLEVREGSRRNPMEQVVTRRDLQDATGVGALARAAAAAAAATGSLVLQDSQGNTVTVPWADVENAIRNSQLYRDLIRSIDDPARFDRFGEQVKALLLPNLAEEAAKLGAAIRRTEGTTQTSEESFAFQQTQITAAIRQAMAGVRQTLWAQAMDDRATGGYVLQITARLDGFDGGTATVEEVATALADRATGLEAQWTLKVSAGGAIAGIGVAATDPIDSEATSAIILMADKVAIVDPSYSGGPDLTPGSADLPFIVSGGVVYLRKAFIKNADIETLKIAGNAVTIPVSVSGSCGNITVGTDVTNFGPFAITEGDEFATYTSPTAVDVDLNNQIVVLGRTGYVGDLTGGPQRRFAIFADSTLIADSGWSYFAADFFNVGVLHTQTVGTSVVYSCRVKARTYPGTSHSESLGAEILILGARR